MRLDKTNSLDAVQNGQNRTGSVWGVLVLSFTILIFAHLVVKEFFSSAVFWVIGAFAIVIVSVIWLLTIKDYFAFILAIFVTVHFAFADNQGGLWSYILIAVLVIYKVLTRRNILKLSSIPIGLNVLIGIFLIHQIIGTASNQYSIISNIQATFVVLSQILVLYCFSSQCMSNCNLKRVVIIWFFLAFWVFLVGLNQHYHWVISNSPLLPQYYNALGINTIIPLGTFGNSELFSEYFCIVFVIALIIISQNKKLQCLHINFMWPFMMIIMASLALILGTSRSAIILTIIATIIIIIDNIIVNPSINNIRRAIIILAVLIITCFIIFKFGNLVNINMIKEKFRTGNISKLSVDTIVSGKGINRDTAFNAALKRLNSKTWWIGYGYNLPENNLKSMGLRKGSADYHNLYLSLPIYYGWIGALSYSLFVIGTAVRSLLCYMKNKKHDNCLVSFAFIFTVLWFVFILDQVKITVTRNPSYFLMTWMWLGMTHAVINTLNKKMETQRYIK